MWQDQDNKNGECLPLNRKLPVNYGFEEFYDPQEKLF